MTSDRTFDSVLDEIELALAELLVPSSRARLAALAAQEREEARDALPTSGAEGAAVSYVGGMLVALAAAGALGETAAVEAVLERCARILGLVATSFSYLVRVVAVTSPRLLELPPHQALDVLGTLVLRLAPLVHLSLWRADDARSGPTFSFGRPADATETKAAAEPDGGLPADVACIPICAHRQPIGTLVMRAAGADAARALPVVRPTAPMFGALLERCELARAGVETERILTEAAEKRLAWLGFDLHDGAMQTIGAVRTELALLEERLEAAGSPTELVAWTAEINEHVETVDRELRDLVQSIETPTALAMPLVELLQREAARVAERTGMRMEIETPPALSALGTSHQVALLRILQESLSNVALHSGASEAHVSIRRQDGYVRADVTDNGQGFDVSSTFAVSGADGRIGLLGMTERARLLGGTLRVDSRPGAGTTVTLTLPEWTDVDDD